ncbi:MAG: helix-turn-helix domain-containing protein [Desulforhopalus sp.]
MVDQEKKIALRLKALRMEKNLSVESLARKSGVSEKDIRGIEENMFSAPLGKIISLAKILEVEVSSLFGDSGDSPYCIVRKSDRKTVSRFSSDSSDSSQYTYESLGLQKKNRNMEPFLVTLAPHKGKDVETNQHPGEELLFVLEGAVHVEILDHTDILYPGDSIYYDSNVPHKVSCHGESPATLLAVIYARNEMLIM